MFRRLGDFAYRRRIWLTALIAVLLGVGAVFGVGVVDRLSGGGFTVQDAEADETAALLAEHFERYPADMVVAYEHPRWAVVDDPFQAELRQIADRLREHEAVGDVRWPSGDESPLRSRDGGTALMMVGLVGDDEAAKLDAFPVLGEIVRDTSLDTQVGGSLAAYATAQELAARDLLRAELVAAPLLFGLLLWLFRSVVAALVPLVIGGVSIAMTMLMLRLLAGVTEVSLLAMNVVTFLGLGLAVDYSLFVVRRFREELAVEGDVAESLRRTSRTAGRTIALSGVAVAASLLGLMWFRIPLLRSVAIGGCGVTLVTLTAALVLLPAMLGLLGRRIDAGHLGRGGGKPPGVEGGWYRLARIVMRRPLVVTVVVSALLLVGASPVRRLQLEPGDAGIFPHHTEVRQVWDRMEDPDAFRGGDLAALEVVVEADEPMMSAANLRALHELTVAIDALPGVDRVDAAVDPSRPASAYDRLARDFTRLPEATRARIERALVDRFAFVHVAQRHPPSSDEAVALMESIRALAPAGMRLYLGGRPVIAAEIDDEIRHAAPLAAGTVVLVTFVVLFIAFGSFVIPVKAIAMNVLSVGVGYGALVWVFQDGRFETLLRYRAAGALDPTILAVTFAVTFGLSMDYEVFLLSRIREEYDLTGDNATSVARGLGRTGRVITGAAAVLVAVVIGFVAGEMIFIKQLGVGLAVAVLVDATIVRALLVPAAMVLMGRFNWWAPGPLQRFWARSGVGVDELASRPDDGPT